MQTSYDISADPFLVDESVFHEGKRYNLVRDLPDESKPRERLEKFGPASLSVAELVAVLLNVGTVKEDVLTMAHRIVKDYGQQSLANQTDAKKLSADLDVPLSKALQIVACAELGRRFFERHEYGLSVIRTAKEVYEYTADMRTLSKEHLRGIYLNTHHRVIHDEIISIGTVDASIIHPREVFKPAIERGAAAVILVHNHPSGVVSPSVADIEITKIVAAAGNVVGIPLVDHVVVGRDGFASIDID